MQKQASWSITFSMHGHTLVQGMALRQYMSTATHYSICTAILQYMSMAIQQYMSMAVRRSAQAKQTKPE